MAEVQLQDLLAPTWVERARADDRLFFSLGGPQEEDMNPWPEAVLQEVAELMPSPEQFLPALVDFWSGVSLQQHNDWMSQCRSKKDEIDAALAARLASPYSALFPMTPAKPPVSESMMRSWGALKLISRLGPFVPLVEQQLLACLEHPVSQIYDAAARAFGTAETMSDEAYRAYLAHADHWGRGGSVHMRSSNI